MKKRTAAYAGGGVLAAAVAAFAAAVGAVWLWARAAWEEEGS